MTEIETGASGRRIAGLARARLATSRWVLAASAAAIVVVNQVAGGSIWVALAAIVLVVAVAIAAPRRRQAKPGAGTAVPLRAELESLPALDLAAAVPDPLIIFDRNGAALYANQAAVAAFGHIPQGTLLALKFRTPEMQDLIADLTGAKRSAATIDYAERVPVDRVYRVAAMPVGKTSGLHAILFKDQSESRRIDRMRADFIANASHELRTPLASIAGFIETIRGPARNDAKARDNFLEIMQTQTARMARLIDDLLSLSRLEMKPHLRSDQKFDIAELVTGVAESLGHVARENGVAISIDRPDRPIAVPGSRDELIQVFENLLENACKYGQVGGRVEVSIAESASGPKPEVAVTIRDYGPGIAEEHIPRITERFYRIDADTSRAQKGTGLGLAIVKHILTRHDGRLTVKSAIGKGAAFTVHLPVD